MNRTARIERQTSESKVLVEVDLDGSGRHDISTGVGFYDHMLTAFARHSLVDLTVQTEGDTHIDAHHTVEAPEGTQLFSGVEGERFYFVHSYAVRDWTLETNDRTRAPLVTWVQHGGDRFVAAVENGPLSATQFHPEKSGDAGAALLRNWVRTIR